jgi:hypothetical protein
MAATLWSTSNIIICNPPPEADPGRHQGRAHPDRSHTRQSANTVHPSREKSSSEGDGYGATAATEGGGPTARQGGVLSPHDPPHTHIATQSKPPRHTPRTSSMRSLDSTAGRSNRSEMYTNQWSPEMGPRTNVSPLKNRCRYSYCGAWACGRVQRHGSLTTAAAAESETVAVTCAAQ